MPGSRLQEPGQDDYVVCVGGGEGEIFSLKSPQLNNFTINFIGYQNIILYFVIINYIDGDGSLAKCNFCLNSKQRDLTFTLREINILFLINDKNIFSPFIVGKLSFCLFH